MRVPHPDIREYSYRDYGNRVGIWRMLDVLDQFSQPCTVSLNTAVLELFPEVAEAIRDRIHGHGWSVMSHGIHNTDYLYGHSEQQEVCFYETCRDHVKRHLGVDLKGMLGPAVSATPKTPDLMARSGFTYHCDWAHDDEPTPIMVDDGRLVSVPYTFQLGDGPVVLGARGGDYFEEICRRQFDALYEEGALAGRVMCIALHPFRIGQPHMIGHLESVLDYMHGFSDVWFTTADEIAAYYLDNYYDQAMSGADGSK
ncbi:hypothetical protein [Actinophytocola sp.]|uniref:hypothetical protein n=1 Tax=Actinophytocola sp. TaxID=1872138 RepID=UPI003D6AF268